MAKAVPLQTSADEPRSAGLSGGTPPQLLGKAAGDTLYLLGGPARTDGKFQNDVSGRIPDPEGWVPEAYLDDPYWHQDSFNAELLDPATVPNQAMYCGATFEPCYSEPVNYGYGNNWDEALGWTGQVADPGLPVTVRVTARMNHDTEPGYDYLHLELLTTAGWTELAFWDGANASGGVFTPVDVDVSAVLSPGDYTGDGLDEVALRWRFTSDGGASDEDCFYFISEAGAAQVDNVQVTFDQGGGPVTQVSSDFEGTGPFAWTPATADCSFAKVWPLLEDPGLNQNNVSPQLAFIDDGTACESPGTLGVTWTYGPGGYVAWCPDWTTLDYDHFVSPPLPVPAAASGFEGGVLEFDVYRHSQGDIGDPFYSWFIRSSSDGGQTWSAWWNHNFVYEQGNKPSYHRARFTADPGIPPGADFVQVKLGVVHLFHGPPRCEGYTPAPYFDNVALKVFRRDGPYLYTTYVDSPHVLLQDAFPAGGGLDLQDPDANAVPLLSPNGDPVAIQAAPRDGADLVGPPRLHWVMRANPLFDAYRTAVPPNPVIGDSVGLPHFTDPRQGIRYSFSFPDSGFFFPGDQLHYYFEAEDDRADGSGLARLPADTTGFSYFPGDAGFAHGQFPRWFQVHALPGLTGTGPGQQPSILVWQDYLGDAADDEWHTALANLGYLPGRDYDLLQSTNPGVRVLGSAVQLAGYSTILYDGGESSTSAILPEESDELKAWAAQGGKNLLGMGDDLASSFRNAGNIDFLNLYFGTFFWSTFTEGDVRQFIGGQLRPTVFPVAGNPAGLTVELVADSRQDYNDFDAVEPYGTGQSLCEWSDPAGLPGGYLYAAGVYNRRDAEDGTYVFLPFGFATLRTPETKAAADLAARTQLLGDILAHFGEAGGAPSAVPAAGSLTVRGYPNPFNPRITIAYELPRTGRLEVSVFDLQGRLVKTLHRGEAAAGKGRLVWDGTDDQGRAVGAGVYFHRVSAAGEVRTGKMMLVK